MTSRLSSAGARRVARTSGRVAVCVTACMLVMAVSQLAGAPDWLSVMAGVTLAVALWRPPPAGARSSPDCLPGRRLTPRQADDVDIGVVVTAPSQVVALLPGDRFTLAPAELQRHVTLIGTSGSGKTTTAARLIDAALASDWPVLVVDAKGGRLATVCRALADQRRVAIRLWLPEGPDTWTYNPCAGSPSAVSNRLVGAFEHGRGDGQIYRNLSQALVPLVIQSLLDTAQECTLDTLCYSLDDAHLAGLARRVTDSAMKAELVSIVNDALHRKALSGLVGRLRSLRFSGFGAALLPSQRTLDLADAVRLPGVTYFGLPATAASEDVALVGRVLIQHLKQVAYGAMSSHPRRTSLVVFDEFASLGEAVQLGDLLLQAREARLAVVVSTQQLPRDVVLRKALLGAGLVIAHQVGSPDDAEMVARALGTRSTTEVVRNIPLGLSGPLARRVLRPRESFVVTPDTLARLATGHAAVSVRFDQQRIALVQVDALPFTLEESER